MYEQVFIGLGSNIPSPVFGLPCQQVQQAISKIAELEAVELVRASSLYSSSPMGPKDQADYVNAVIHIRCTCSADTLLDQLQSIEQLFGRERKQERWGPRTMDLDILLFDQQLIQTKRLTVPHYGLAGREFVLVPLFEVAPEMVMPDGRPLATWVADCSLKGLRRMRNEPEVKEISA